MCMINEALHVIASYHQSSPIVFSVFFLLDVCLSSYSHTGGPTARLAWAGARARRLWALKAKYTSTGGEGTGEGARGTGTSACYLDFVSCPGLSNFLGPPLYSHETMYKFVDDGLPWWPLF
jgi:hypothetical protein